VSYIVPLDACEPHLAEVVGAKAVGLGSLLRAKLDVPAGFAIGARAYREFVSGGIDREIREQLARAGSLEEHAAASARIQSLFEEHRLQHALRDELQRAYDELGQPPAAVRSSATSEDSAGASFAGQHETFLWQQGVDAVATAVVRCWASLFTLQALAYVRHVGITPEKTAMSVIVQTMVAAETAGVMFTLDPVTGDRSQITIEASFGLGDAVAAGHVTPDRYAVDKVTLAIRSRTIAAKQVASRFDAGLGGVRLVDVPADERERPSLSDEKAVAVATLGKRVERAIGAPQDVEWAIAPDGEVYLLQTRAETVWSQRPLEQAAGAIGSALRRFS
jgi:phosphoenolpyruvate synthase/pyruvate phosphate dikinase